ncbi:MAG TPA: hypothetical protein VGH57_08460 [Amycolatopsis sp.]|jgi:hypothetical protein
MAEGLSGLSESMMKFSPQMDSGGLSRQGGAAAGGGMQEGTAFAQAEEAAAQKLQQFMEQVKQGFGAYAGIARASADDYLNADQSGQQSVAKSQNLSPFKSSAPLHPSLLFPSVGGN